MPTSTLTRRAALTGTATGAAALAIGAATATAGHDAELLRLWAEYTERCEAYRVARRACREVRAAFDAIAPTCPASVLPGHHWEALAPLRAEYRVDVLYDAWEDAGSLVRNTVEDIRRTPAEGIVGVAIKLLAQPGGWQEEDLAEAAEIALADIRRLTGLELPEPQGMHVHSYWEDQSA